MDLTESFNQYVPSDVLERYSFAEVRNASAVIASACPHEWQEVMRYLSNYQLKTEELMTPGGSKSLVVSSLEQLFYKDGWYETRVDTEQLIYKVIKRTGEHVPLKLSGFDLSERLRLKDNESSIEFSTVFQEGYLVDAIKGRLAVDIEWNAKDGNLDRDISAYRAWYELGLIDGAILITKEMESCRLLVKKIWNDYCKRSSKAEEKSPVNLGTSTTTSLEKARERIKRGDGGGCPIVIIGITDRCWDGQPYTLTNKN